MYTNVVIEAIDCARSTDMIQYEYHVYYKAVKLNCRCAQKG